MTCLDSWKALPESVIMAPSLNCFKSRLNSHWKKHPYKFDPWCYIPGPKPRDYYQNTPTEAVLPVPMFQLCELCELKTIDTFSELCDEITKDKQSTDYTIEDLLERMGSLDNDHSKLENTVVDL